MIIPLRTTIYGDTGASVWLWIAIDPALSELVYNYLDIIVLGKSDSDSGVARNSWNVIALQNFFDSFGLGVGLGTVRTSSFLIALLANVGIPGFVVYGCFAYGAFVRKRGVRANLTTDVRLTAHNGCLGLLAGDMLASPGLDQGLFFCISDGFTSSELERNISGVRVAPSQGVAV